MCIFPRLVNEFLVVVKCKRRTFIIVRHIFVASPKSSWRNDGVVLIHKIVDSQWLVAVVKIKPPVATHQKFCSSPLNTLSKMLQSGKSNSRNWSCIFYHNIDFSLKFALKKSFINWTRLLVIVLARSEDHYKLRFSFVRNFLRNFVYVNSSKKNWQFFRICERGSGSSYL